MSGLPVTKQQGTAVSSSEQQAAPSSAKQRQAEPSSRGQQRQESSAALRGTHLLALELRLVPQRLLRVRGCLLERVARALVHAARDRGDELWPQRRRHLRQLLVHEGLLLVLEGKAGHRMVRRAAPGSLRLAALEAHVDVRDEGRHARVRAEGEREGLARAKARALVVR